MDIKVLKNFDISRAEFINKSLVLCVIDDPEKELGNFNRQKLSVINIETNEKTDISPDLDICLSENVIYASLNRDYVVFSSIDDDESGYVTITWYLYKCYGGKISQLHSIKAEPDSLEKTVFIKVFVLDELHMLVQTEKVTGSDSSFWFKIYNSESCVISDVTIPRLTDTGIQNMIPISDGNCVIKFGRSFIPDKPFGYKPPGFNREFIGMVPVNKFISELSIDMDNRFVELLEESTDLTTLPYMKAIGSLIIYAIYYPSEEKEDIILYDTESGKKTVRINSRLNSINDLWHTFVIGDKPYLISGRDGGSAKITDLNTQKVVAKINAGDDIPAVCGNYVVLAAKRKKLLKEIEYVEVYEFSKLMKEAAFSVKASFEYCIVSGDTMILFINDNKTEDER